uniref:Uncharacterized protein n=1 Tax=Lactuca sativa TaxID=4236 RepID=A0A9R1W9A6_LACSA|nr:hypothetical protein LSAT_V11C200076300 [Lactuca sativa]
MTDNTISKYSPIKWIVFHRNIIYVKIIVGQHDDKKVYLPRIHLCSSDDDMFLSKLKRKQLPIRLCFAMTINKARENNFECRYISTKIGILAWATLRYIVQRDIT